MPLCAFHGRTSLAAGLLALCALPGWARAQALDASEAPTAVQERKYGYSEEIRVGVGSLPLNPFQKGWTGSLSYTHHFSDLWAWEILHATGAFLVTSTSLRDELITTQPQSPEAFTAPRLMLTTGAEITPFYGKQVFHNRGTVHGSIVLGAHAGVAFGDRPSLSEVLEDIRPTVGGGLAFKLFFNQTFSTRLESRLFATFRGLTQDNEPVEAETVLLISLSVALGFGGRP